MRRSDGRTNMKAKLKLDLGLKHTLVLCLMNPVYMRLIDKGICPSARIVK